MNSKFIELKSEKKQTIINASLKEFAQKGFNNASTNEIVKEAGISKGLLFHYFNNKKALFLYLYEYTIDIFMREFFEKIDLNEKDILIRLKLMAQLKVELIRIHPDMFDFIMTANNEDSSDVRNELEEKNKGIFEISYKKLFENIDVSYFKPDVDIKRAINIIIWTLEGLRNVEQEKAKSEALDYSYYKKVLDEMDSYLEILRKCFYK